MSSTHLVITRLTHEFPEFQTMLEEHLEDNFGELLPFLYLSDIAPWCSADAAKSRSMVASSPLRKAANS